MRKCCILCILNYLCICFTVYCHEKCPCKICFVLLVNNIVLQPLDCLLEQQCLFGRAVKPFLTLVEQLKTPFLAAFSHCSHRRVLFSSRKMYWIIFVSLSCSMSNQSNYRYWLTDAWSFCVEHPLFALRFCGTVFFLYSLFEFYATFLWVKVFSWCPGMRFIYLNIFSNL